MPSGEILSLEFLYFSELLFYLYLNRSYGCQVFPGGSDGKASASSTAGRCLTIWATREDLVAQMVRHLPAVLETWVQSLSQEDPLEKEMATHSSILAWRIPRTEVPGGLQSMGSQSQIQLTLWFSPRVPISFQQYFIQHC